MDEPPAKNESEAAIEELEKLRATGAITEDEYWNTLWLIEKKTKGLKDYDEGWSIDAKVSTVGIWLLPVIIITIAIYFLFYYYPAPSGIEIKVRSTGTLPVPKDSKEAVYRGLEFMQLYSPEDYQFVDNYTDTIEVVSQPIWNVFFSRGVAGYFPVTYNRTIRLVRDRGLDCPAYCESSPWTGRDLWAAEVIIHEACHSMQYLRGDRSFNERECYDMGFAFARKAGPLAFEDFEERYFVYEPSSQSIMGL